MFKLTLKSLHSFYLKGLPKAEVTDGVDVYDDELRIGWLHTVKMKVYHPKDTSKKYPLVLFLHGFMGGGHYVPFCSWLAKEGYVVVAPQIRWQVVWGVQDSNKVLDYVLGTSIDCIADLSDVTVLGHSLGAMNALAVGAQHSSVTKIISIAPYYQEQIIKYFFDFIKECEKIVVPTLLICGGDDWVCPCHSVINYYDAIPFNKKFQRIDGEDHLMGIIFFDGSAPVLPYVASFLKFI